MENVERAAELLAPFRITSDQIMDFANIADDGAIVLLAGTFNQRLATPTSDIDLLLIYPEDRFVDGLSNSRLGTKLDVYPTRHDELSFPRENILIVNRTISTGQKIQTNVIRADYIKRLQDGIKARNDDMRGRLDGRHNNRRRVGRLIDFEEQVMLHRTYTGTALHNDAARLSLISRLPLTEISYNVSIRETSGVQSYISDLVGLTSLSGSAEIETINLMEHKILMHLCGAVLASVDELSPQEKLMFRLLKRYSSEIGTDIVNDLLSRFRDRALLVREDPRSIIEFVKDIFSRLRTMDDYTRREYDLWNEETDYPEFQLDETFRDAQTPSPAQ